MPPGRAGRPGRAAGAARAAVRASGRGTCVRKGRRPPGLPSRWAPGTGPLLLLTLSLGLAGAQQAPDEVPVQPGFDARKVTVPLGPRLGLGPGRGCKCRLEEALWGQRAGGGRTPTGRGGRARGAPRGGCPTPQGGGLPPALPAPGSGQAGPQTRPCLCDPTCPSPVTVGAGVVPGGGCGESTGGCSRASLTVPRLGRGAGHSRTWCLDQSGGATGRAEREAGSEEGVGGTKAAWRGAEADRSRPSPGSMGRHQHPRGPIAAGGTRH